MKDYNRLMAALILVIVMCAITACGQKQDGDPSTNAKLTTQRQAVIARHKGL